MIVRRTSRCRKGNCANALALGLILSAVGLSAAAQTRLSPEDCLAVTRHLPDPSVTYQPGIGVGGRHVAPAELSPPPRVVPETPVIYLGVDLQTRYGLPPSLDVDLPIGLLTFDGTRLLLNGRPLSSEDQSALARACAAARRR
jgi:hypothetical protein